MQKISTFFITALLPILTYASSACSYSAANTCTNDIPPRLQWLANHGYCGEVSLISAGLYYGQYVSQYDVRAIAGQGALQTQTQLIIGINDVYTANQMHLNALEWDTDAEQNTAQFLAWIKQNVVKRYPVLIGIYVNQYLYDHDTDPNDGDSDYDHIVPVTAVASNSPLSDPHYYSSDIIYFSDNGIWPINTEDPPYIYCYPCARFQASRKQANARKAPIYTVSNDASNYGVAITGVMDLNGDTLPVRVATNVNYENPPIADKSNTRPDPMPLTLTITISNLEPNTPYVLYRYKDFASVPNSKFNASAGKAHQMWPVHIDSGSTFTMTQDILSNEIAVYRAVKASAP